MLFTHHRHPSTIICDNEAVIRTLQKQETLKPLSPEWDFMEPSRKYVSTHQIHCKHVKGHQDSEKKELNREEKLNCEADKLATQGIKQKTIKSFTPGHCSSLTLNEKPITTKYPDEISRSYSSPDMAIYLQNKLSLSLTHIESIDWDAFASNVKTLPIARRFRLIKQLHRWLPTREQQSRLHHSSPLCECGEVETVHHLRLCPLQTLPYTKIIEDLQTHLRTLRTHRHLATIIVDLAKNSPRKYKTMLENDDFRDEIKIAIAQQQQLGDDLLWQGLLIQKFGDIQESFYRHHKYDNTWNGTYWSRQVVKFFIVTFEQLWKNRNDRIFKTNRGMKEKKEITEKLEAIERKEFFLP